MPSKSAKNVDLFNTTSQSTLSCMDDATEKLKQLRARNKTLKDERDQIGHEYDEVKQQLEKSEAANKQLLEKQKGLDSEMEYLRRGNEENDSLRARVTEAEKEIVGFKTEMSTLKRENSSFKVEMAMLKNEKAKLKSDNEKLTSNLMMAIDEKGEIEQELNDVRSQLREAQRKLDDEVNIFSGFKEKSQKEAKQRMGEIARLKEDCSKMESELIFQRGELKERDSKIEELENKIVWLEANKASSNNSRVDENGLYLPDSSETSEGDMGDSMESTIIMENSKLEDLDDFLDNIQKHHGKGMKAQSADPDLLTFGRSESLHSPSCKSTDGSRKSPKGRPSMLRRMSTFFFSQDP